MLLHICTIFLVETSTFKHCESSGIRNFTKNYYVMNEDEARVVTQFKYFPLFSRFTQKVVF